MLTRLLSPSPDTYSMAADILKSGGLVAFPTETVYGLGANALDSDAVLSVFSAKGRPADNPLIVHICPEMLTSNPPLKGIVRRIPEKARELMNAFWPGPMTLIFKKKDIVK